MGLIRKTLMISTGGIVRGSSKKQRVAKASLKELRAQTRYQQAAAAAAVQQASQVAPMPAGPPVAPPPGWYPSPQQAGQMQWWDGAQWTPSFAPQR
ncbi:DUF2510 domain-containing protein [Amycolatopsis sp. FDAARGOS 1241]|uniref:DUF2510 domain-containing protein n=1 Tax=Amycolatopsis sp. FDAARGOS 1241 TaxID=2778070 RepID=UPI00195010E7|nr:DUF2510 domain-containing protein [Amycolatopsis sp. FDAARGOS 1241]QRP48021.1 DUF2510 domain-containing protein [Amycolatopsis sp. FDAARGOS 1241]